MAENKEAIVLDSTDNVFVGPNEYFKIVIDEFDGESVQAWHIEDSMGNSTMNLARGEGKHIDALVNKDCRTVWHFGSRVAPAIIAEEQAKVEELKAQIDELKAQMGEGEAMMEEGSEMMEEESEMEEGSEMEEESSEDSN